MSTQLTEFLLRLTFRQLQPTPAAIPTCTLSSDQLFSHIYTTLNAQHNHRCHKTHKSSLCSDDTGTPLMSPVRCNCKKSRCLKLYCECFARGTFCKDCNCVDCHNNQRYAQERARAIDQMLMKTTPSFGPKNSSGKGCNCKKTGCIKKYCQCYNSGKTCNQFCKCTDCKNHQ